MSRSRGGCWNCKQIRRKCDEERPSCQRCISRHVVCEGYDTRLQWGVGVASRGYLIGAAVPDAQNIRKQTRGRKRDVLRNARRVEEATDGSTAQKPSPTESIDDSSPPTSDLVDDGIESGQSSHLFDVAQARLLFSQFLEHGATFLICGRSEDCPLFAFPAGIENTSTSLLAICAAIQTFLVQGDCLQFLHYYDLALVHFRRELEQARGQLQDGSLHAGVFLCTVGILRCTPYTMHLDALDKICFKDMASHPFCDWSPFAQSALEVAGILEIPTSILGRQRPCLHLWRRLRDSQSYSERGLLAGVEPVSGLPRSLLDIFARIEEPQAALRFLQWPGELGSLLVCHLWEAYRIAGVLVAISMRAETHASNTPSASDVPPAANLVNRLLASIAAVLATGDDNIEHKKIMGTNILLYPIVTAATQKSVLEENSKWTEVVRDYFRQCAGSTHSRRVELCWTLVEKLWQREDNICLHELARQEGLEIGLF